MTALQFLFSLERLGMKFGLENMRAICAALGHPESAFRSVIVAGTNGKGSVAAMLSAALHAGGHRVGRYTSPHLERIEERYVIAETPVSPDVLERVAATVRDGVDRLVAAGTLASMPTFFECATAIAFELFRGSVDVAVVEVGLGGRLDATNVLTPVAAAITTIGFDHQDLLGDSLAEIAREKAGVIKPGIPVVAGRLPADALAVVVDVCRRQRAQLVQADDVRRTAAVEGGRTVVSLSTPRTALQDVRLALAGRHQVDNAAVALCVMEALDRQGIGLDAAAMRAGLERPRWPGRLEHLSWRGADVLLDAAHNPEGAQALAAYLAETAWTGVALVIGIMADKDVDGIVAALAPHASRVICTRPPSPRAMPADALAALVRGHVNDAVPVESIADPAEAVECAADNDGRIVVAGSIFLLGAVRGILR